MEPGRKVYPLIVIVGETASGKSDLAMELARKFKGEIISADSRTIYKSLDIGTAKPSIGDQTEIKHHLLDITEPDQQFSVLDFQKLANQAFREIYYRDKLPILVGGSGLYIDSVIFDYDFSKNKIGPDRDKLNNMTIEDLLSEMRKLNIPLPKDPKNPRRLVRAIETGGVSNKRSELRRDTLIVGIKIDRSKLEGNIRKRIEVMLDLGLVNEAKIVSSKYGWDAKGLQSTSYKALRNFIEGLGTLDDAKNEFANNDMRLARRQRTWFARNESIQWVESREAAVDLVTTFLNKYM